MKKTRNKCLKLQADLEIKYDGYNSKKENKKAENQIIRWVRYHLEKIDTVPLYVAKSWSGHIIEETSKRAKYTLKKKR